MGLEVARKLAKGGKCHKNLAFTPGTRATHFLLPRTTSSGFLRRGQLWLCPGQAVGLLSPRPVSRTSNTVLGVPAVPGGEKCSLLRLGHSWGPQSGGALLGGAGRSCELRGV